MGLILPQTISIVASGNMASYYEKLGYNIPKYYDKRRNKFSIVNGTRIDVSVKDLKINSNLYVKVKCDICGEEEKITYMEYNRLKTYIEKYGHDYLCLDCKFDIMPTAKLNVGTFKNDKERIRKFLIRKLSQFMN